MLDVLERVAPGGCSRERERERLLLIKNNNINIKNKNYKYDGHNSHFKCTGTKNTKKIQFWTNRAPTFRFGPKL